MHARRQTPWIAILVTTGIALVLITYVSLAPDSPAVAILGGTTSLLLLTVFCIVNVTVLVLRKDSVEHKHFSAGKVLPVLGALFCAYLVLPWTSGRDLEQYRIAGILVALGVVLWAITYAVNKRARRDAGRMDRSDVD